MRGMVTSVLATTSKISCSAATTFSSPPFTWKLEQVETGDQKRGKPQKWPDVYFLLELFQWFQKEDDANDDNDADAMAGDADYGNAADDDDNLNTSIWWLGCTSGIDFDCSAAILSDLLDALTTLSNYLRRKQNLEYIEKLSPLFPMIRGGNMNNQWKSFVYEQENWPRQRWTGE